RDKKESVAVRRRTYDRLGGEIGGGARSAFDDNRLAEPLREPLARQASGNVSRAARGIAEDQPKRLSRIGLSPSDAWKGREGGNARCQMQKVPAWKFHDACSN